VRTVCRRVRVQVLGCGWVRVRVRVCVCMCVCMCWAAGGCDLRALLVHWALVYSSRLLTSALEQGIRRRQADLADHLTGPTRPDRPGQTNLARSIRGGRCAGSLTSAAGQLRVQMRALVSIRPLCSAAATPDSKQTY
jgi:hypothetical protein